MNAMTKSNLMSAYGGESMAHMRYIAFAKMAEDENFKNVSRLFQAVSFAEQVHATNHFRALKNEFGDAGVNAGAAFGYINTSKNLELAIEGEDFEIKQMYPAYLAVAEMQAEKDAIRSMKWAWEVEKQHFSLYTDAKKAVDSGKDMTLGDLYVCECCGATQDSAPDKCPICGAKKELFKKF